MTIPFTKEELARLLEDANRLLEVRRLRIEVLEGAIRSAGVCIVCAAIQRADSSRHFKGCPLRVERDEPTPPQPAETKHETWCTSTDDPCNCKPPQPAGGEAPERTYRWLEPSEDGPRWTSSPMEFSKVLAEQIYVRADLHATELARSEAAEKIADAALEASGSAACWLGDKLLMLVNAYGLEKERIDAARGKR